MTYTVTDTFSNGPVSDCGATAIININLAIALDNGSTNNAGAGVVTQAKVSLFSSLDDRIRGLTRDTVWQLRL